MAEGKSSTKMPEIALYMIIIFLTLVCWWAIERVIKIEKQLNEDCVNLRKHIAEIQREIIKLSKDK